MNKMSIQQLINLFEELDNAIFFDGAGEFHINSKYTTETWQNSAHKFLDCYQRIIDSNTEATKYSFLLKDKQIEQQIENINTFRSRLQKNRNQNDISNNNAANELSEEHTVVDEPFDGYYELLRKMHLAKEVLVKLPVQAEVLPLSTNDIQNIGGFRFVFNGNEVITVQYGETFIKISRKMRCALFGIMKKCYGSYESISMDEIRESYQNKTDSEKNIREMISKMNKQIRSVVNTQENLVVNASTDGPRRFKINHRFFANS